jgi:hypothetical protein
VRPSLQVSWQRLSTHATVPSGIVAHRAPQTPQFAASVERSTQTFLQLVVPPVQTAVHTPPEHVVPGPQTVPQAPQFAGSESSRRQALPHAE